jgi:glycolate oxidase FAD binding subunit
VSTRRTGATTSQKQDIAAVFSGLGDFGPDWDAFAVDGATPHVALTPRSVDHLAEAVRRANEEGLVIAPRGGGTKTSLGNAPVRLDLALSTAALNAVLDHQPANLTVTVQAGCALAAVQAVLAKHGQLLPLESPLPSRATIGGILAANASGPHRLAYGPPRDWAIGSQFVTGDGVLVRAGGKVVKNVTGFDLTRLHVGALGTLGVLTEVSFKVAPVPAARRTLIALLPSFAAACDAALAMDREGIGPMACVTLNAEAVRRLLLDTLPLHADQAVLTVEVGGTHRVIPRREADVLRVLRLFNSGPHEPLDSAEAFWQSVTDLGWGDTPQAIALRCATAPGHVSALAAHFRDLPLRGVGLVSTPALGLLRAVARTEPGVDLPPGSLAQTLTTLRQATTPHSGYVILECCEPAAKAGIDVWGAPAPFLGTPAAEGGATAQATLMRRVKQQLDPKDILNPGRYVGGL